MRFGWRAYFIEESALFVDWPGAVWRAANHVGAPREHPSCLSRAERKTPLRSPDPNPDLIRDDRGFITTHRELRLARERKMKKVGGEGIRMPARPNTSIGPVLRLIKVASVTLSFLWTWRRDVIIQLRSNLPAGG